MSAELLVLVALPLLLVTAAVYDLASFTIPNFLTATLLAMFAVFALAAGLGLPAIGWHVLAGVAGLVLGFALFAFG
ncbi:MAG TPA: prepilin peptidase, partial [Rhizomicrobium sp.]|nr:prepilin peptidase [Rhizomicrobium sp.]